MKASRAVLIRAFGFLVKKRRADLDISQEELADRCDLDRTYISGIERGRRNPSLTALAKFADGLNITVADLLDRLEEEVQKVVKER